MAVTWRATKQIALTGASLVAMLAAGPALAQTSGASAAGEATVDEIVVTGTSIRGVPPTGSNLIGVTREDIKAVGAATAPELLASVPQLNSFNTAPRAANAGAGSFAPGLRSLPASATLPLLNGHRLVAGGANETNPDFPFVPDLAIERVEIVADGASSIYGSDAIAGVVNFITRKRYSGVEMSARYGVAEDYESFSVSGLAGRDWAGEWGDGSILAAYQYSENGNVTGADRDYRIVDFRPFGGVDTRGTSCPSPNLVVGGVVHAAPTLTPNTTNYCDVGAPVDLVPASRLHSAFVTARQDVGERVTLWGDLLYSDRKDAVQAAIPGQTVTLTAANPFFRAPAGSAATAGTVFFRPDNLVGADHFDQTYHVKAGNSSAGADVLLPRDFNLSLYGTYDWSRHVAFQPMINPVALAQAAAGTSPSTALDPFGEGTAPTVVQAITDYSTSVTIKQRTKVAAAKIDGPLFDLPAGELKIAAGVEYRKETFQQRGFVGVTPVPENLGRDIKSVYGELFVPVVGDANSAPLIHRLSLSLSGRYDHYSDFGSTTNPKVGVNWDPVEGVTIRGTYGRSFRAPGLRDVGATVGAYYLDAVTAGVAARDPTRGSAQVNTVYLLGGNKDLQPEKAETYSLGVDWRPTFLPELRAGVTFYSIDFTDVIGTPPTAMVFTDPTFSSVVYRDPTAAQLSGLLAIAVPVNLPTPLPTVGNLLDLRRGNFGVRKTNGLDFDVNYRRATDFGAVFGGVAGNYILKYDTRLSPTAPVSNSLRLGVPRATVRTTLGATAGPVSVVGFVNYRDGVTNTYATPTGLSQYEAKSYTTVDLRLNWTLPDAGWTQGTELALQVNDVFDEEPPFFPATDGIGGGYNPIGRFVAVNLRKTF
ncbi:TonB-dependent receptor [Phenylobacterium zucineum HLK1]|uniref:TonB-dependent receptor n=1 Tax=Phenylobacterium zucineum (strain HLK1) TaxID=450851 RepID=B4RGL8_PHEZH|nr:TonB-dependent receptor [Phenylobacterium zucineum]ACG78924.1 TonB-dependent receptor [Phenylobacterium zucineum HLK1]